jgi:hypothetical protein
MVKSATSKVYVYTMTALELAVRKDKYVALMVNVKVIHALG